MKITSFNFTIEVSKDENGYSNNYYVDVTNNGVNISNPYVTQSAEQVMFITKLIHDFIAQSIDFNTRVDDFNRDYNLEQYAPQLSSDISTEEAEAIEAAKLSSQQELESAIPQPSDSPVGTTDPESIEVVDSGDRLE